MYSSQNDHIGNITIEQLALINDQAKWGGAISISGGVRISTSGNSGAVVVNNMGEMMISSTGALGW